MLTYFQAIVMGLAQGITELFPVSSLGHSVILPKLLGWNLNQSDPFFLTFLVATHFATALVLLGFFWRDWRQIIKGLGRSLAKRQILPDDYYARLGWLLVVGTIPAAILGLLLQDSLRALFASARVAAFALILNGLALYGAELLRRRAPENQGQSRSNERLGKLKWAQSITIGTAQIISLIPGFSRSGSTMAGGLLAGLSHEDAAKFSFLLATPIIGAAAALKLPDFLLPENRGLIGPGIIGALCAAAAAYFSVKFLMKYFRTNKITPFAVYCFSAGVIFTAIFYFR